MERKTKQELRKGNRYIPSGNHYRKINETYMSPGDGKGFGLIQSFGEKATDKNVQKVNYNRRNVLKLPGIES